jgi:hypothetical protein
MLSASVFSEFSSTKMWAANPGGSLLQQAFDSSNRAALKGGRSQDWPPHRITLSKKLV